MNEFCTNLHLPYEPVSFEFIKKFVENNHKNLNTPAHLALSLGDLDTKFVLWLYSLKIKPAWIPLFYKPANYYDNEAHSDHDADTLRKFVKLNWVFDGPNGLMHWYAVKNDYRGEEFKTPHGLKYYSYKDSSQLIKVHSESVGFPSLVTVGEVPHSITVDSKPRYCLCIVFRHYQTNQTLTMSEAQEVFKNYIVR